MQVKVFTNQGNAPKLELEINEWLKNNTKIQISHVKQSYAYESTGDQFYALISVWYTIARERIP